MSKVRKNPITGTVRVPVGKTYNISTGKPKPANGCAVVAFGAIGAGLLAGALTGYALWQVVL